LGKINQVRASGGGVKNAFWRQILASVLETELVTVNTTEGAAFGAALLAGVGAGVWENVPSACEATIKVDKRVLPDPAQVEAYRTSYPQFQSLYPILKPSFEKMT
jgi:xylulokinase